MDSETSNCQNCKKDFVIESDDFAFYEKMKVPAPTWCPECRQQRRYAWRNPRVLYRKNCDLCGKSTVTMYSPNKTYKVYCSSCWWSDKWSTLDYGQDFDFSRSFFEQFQELQLKVPRIAILSKNSVNSDFTNHSNNCRNCYLGYSVFDSEYVYYSAEILTASQNICDCYWIESSQLIYELINSSRCYQCQYGILLRDCNDCYYCYDCRGCSNCFLSSNLRNKKYYFLNRQYTKEEYLEKLKGYNLGSFKQRQKLFQIYVDLMKNSTVHRFAVIENSVDASGNMIFNSKNVHHVFEVSGGMENAKYSVVSVGTKDSMDCFNYGFRSELVYECHALIHDYDVMFSHLCYDNSHLQYCDGCQNSENLFGCVGMNQGSYSILNKKYNESEYKELRSKIIEHMKKTGEYGEFFPPRLSPFGYNETEGIIHMPLTKEEALSHGYKWEDLLPGIFGKETLLLENIPDDIKNVDDSILKDALKCVNCSKNYNIVKLELDFYRHENIPIPRICYDCRYKNRMAIRTPRKLWNRKCMKPGCTNEFETSYAPDRPETVYCETCYNNEVA